MDEEKELIECRECEGDGEVQVLASPDDGMPDDRPPKMSDLETAEVDCRRCGGRGTEYDGYGCPRCGSGQEAISDMTMPSGMIKQSCGSCPWWDLLA